MTETEKKVRKAWVVKLWIRNGPTPTYYMTKKAIETLLSCIRQQDTIRIPDEAGFDVYWCENIVSVGVGDRVVLAPGESAVKSWHITDVEGA